MKTVMTLIWYQSLEAKINKIRNQMVKKKTLANSL